jgi:hypothetical protein
MAERVIKPPFHRSPLYRQHRKRSIWSLLEPLSERWLALAWRSDIRATAAMEERLRLSEAVVTHNAISLRQVEDQRLRDVQLLSADRHAAVDRLKSLSLAIKEIADAADNAARGCRD